MPRRSRRRDPDPRPLVGVPPSVEEGDDGAWLVRPVTNDRTYRCPGCDQEVPRRVPHVVAWRPWDAEDRRHWHTPCWRARDRRTVKVQRSKNAPRHG